MESITVYYRGNSGPCLKAIDFFEAHNIKVILKKIDIITHKEIFQLIYLSDLNISDVLKRGNKYSFFLQMKKSKLNKLRFKDSLLFLERHTELLEAPILLSNKHSLSGYNEQKIKEFLF